MIDTDASLATLLPQLNEAEWVALDLEGDSLHSYPEKVCLIQISIPGADVLIDPLAKMKLAPLWKALKDRELIMHGCDYDMRMFRKDFNFRPARVFDTKEAARLIGIEQFSLANLVKQFEDVTLNKGSQKADWSMRPLTDAMEEYARNDTRHLFSVASKLKAELEKLGRLSWHREMCERLVEESSVLAEVDEERCWRIKGSYILQPLELAVLKGLWHWREAEAIRRNRPPYYVFNHSKMIAVAQAGASKNGYQGLLPKKWPSRNREDIKRIIDEALALPAAKHPKPLRNTHPRPDPVPQGKFDKLKKHRDATAKKLKIDPTLIASRAVLENLARNWEAHSEFLMNWQRELLENSSTV